MRRCIALLLIVTASTMLAVGQGNVETFDRDVESARTQWGVPGMSIAVVQDGRRRPYRWWAAQATAQAGPLITLGIKH